MVDMMSFTGNNFGHQKNHTMLINSSPSSNSMSLTSAKMSFKKPAKLQTIDHTNLPQVKSIMTRRTGILENIFEEQNSGYQSKRVVPAYVKRHTSKIK